MLAYRIVSGEGCQNLEYNVNAAIRDGWQISGGANTGKAQETPQKPHRHRLQKKTALEKHCRKAQITMKGINPRITFAKSVGGIRLNSGKKQRAGAILPPRTKTTMDAACDAFFARRGIDPYDGKWRTNPLDLK